jgi:hypothetical protein
MFKGECSLDEAQRNPGRWQHPQAKRRLRNQNPDYALLHPGYELDVREFSRQ